MYLKIAAIFGIVIALIESAHASIYSDGDEKIGYVSPLEKLGVIDMIQTRGERNNNPGNIRKSSNSWRGKIAGNDSAFETFDTAENGIRALAKLLRNYQINYGLSTVVDIIARYAPSSENNTMAYVDAVANRMGVNPSDFIDLANPTTLQKMVTAVIHHENGRVIYSEYQIYDGVTRV